VLWHYRRDGIVLALAAGRPVALTAAAAGRTHALPRARRPPPLLLTLSLTGPRCRRRRAIEPACTAGHRPAALCRET